MICPPYLSIGIHLIIKALRTAGGMCRSTNDVQTAGLPYRSRLTIVETW
jgi:hypothetical protein